MKYILLLILLIAFCTLDARETEDDFRLWAGFQVHFRLDQQWQIKLKNQARFYDDQGLLGLLYIQGEINSDISKRHKILLRYRYTTEADETYNLHRIAMAYSYERKIISKLSVSGRLMYQYEQRVFTRQPFSKLRSKLSAEYKLGKKTEVEMEYEFFLQYKKAWEKDKHRLTLLLNREITKKLEVNLGGRMDYMVDKAVGRRHWILETGLRYKI